MPLNGNGRCFECENGDWYCPGENGDKVDVCPGQGGPGWEQVGTAWLPLDLFRRHGFEVWVRVHCREDGTHKVDLWLRKVLEELPYRDSIVAAPMERELEILRRVHEHKWLVKVSPPEKDDDEEE